MDRVVDNVITVEIPVEIVVEKEVIRFITI